MPDTPDRSKGTSDDPLAQSRALNRSALEAVTSSSERARNHEGSPMTPALADRLRAIRASLDLVPPLATTGSRTGEAGARLSVALAALPSGERRRFARWPLIRPCLLTLDGMRMRAATLDIGAGGVMLAPVPMLGSGDVATATLELSPSDRTPATIMIDRDGVGHLAFDEVSGHRLADLRRWLQACAASYELALWQAAALANDVEALFEVALRTQALSPRALFAQAGYSPDALNLFDEALAPLLSRAVPVDTDLAYVASVDAHGYVTAEFAGPSQTQPRRGRRIRDTVTLRAARFAVGPTVQSYRQLPGREPAGMVGDVSAPVFIRGHRWGCVQIGRNPVSLRID
jgi:methyl-accepting chemotaxis protein